MVQITDTNARAAADAAARLMNDPFLAETLDEMVQLATDTAIRGPTPAAREEARHKVLAIIELRGNLQAVFDNWQSAAKTLQQQRAHE
jgi:hypothetical protein